MDFGFWDYLLLLICVVSVALYYLWKKTQFFKERNIRAMNGNIIFGNMFKIYTSQEHVLDLLAKIYKKFPNERYVGFFNFISPIVLVKDPELIKKVTIKEFDHFTNHMEFITEDVDPVSAKMLFMLKDEKWREMRNALSPAFTSSKMRGMLPFMQECAENLIKHFEGEIENQNVDGKGIAEIEMKDPCTRYSNDVIATCGFGIKTNSLKEQNNTFYTMSKKFTVFTPFDSFVLGVLFICPFLLKVFTFRFEFGKVIPFFRELVQSNIKEREENNIVRQDMIHLLMLAKQGNLHDESTEINSSEKKIKKTEWTEDDITAQVLLFLFAGFESTATLLNFLAYEMAINPEVQKQLQDEIDEFLIANNGSITYEGLLNLKYLDMVVSETLRLWPVAPNIDRLCTKDFQFPPQNDTQGISLKIKKDDLIWIPTAAIHRDPKYFPMPDKFIPERFSSENKGDITPFTYLPFGLGPRACIASRFALLETKVFIVNLLSKFDFVTIPKTPVPMKLKCSLFDMVAANGCWVGIRARQERAQNFM